MLLILKVIVFGIVTEFFVSFYWLIHSIWLHLQVEPIRNFFAALFLASIGMLIHVQFLWNHVDILLAAVILVIIVKTVVVALVVKGFGYSNRTAFLVSSLILSL